MFSLRPTYFTLGFILLFSGCAVTNTNEASITIPKKTTPIVKKEIIKTPIKVKPKKKIVIKKKNTYKYCSKHTKVMTHAAKYIKEEFEKGYFVQKDFIGAKAQLFLIESKSPTIFAKNINTAQDSYIKQYKLAKKYKCNIKAFNTFPLTKIKSKLKSLEKTSKEKQTKK